MPALPCVQLQAVDPDANNLVIASRPPLRSHRFICGFLTATLAIRRQLNRTDGLVGYALNAQLARQTFWTCSAWTDRQANALAAADPHRRIVQRLRPRMNGSRFEFLQVRDADIPSDWDTRIEAPPGDRSPDDFARQPSRQRARPMGKSQPSPRAPRNAGRSHVESPTFGGVTCSG